MSMRRLALVCLLVSGCDLSLAPPPSDAKALTAFSFTAPAANGTLNDTRVTVLVPLGTDVKALVASFQTTGASVTVGDVVQESGVTANDFTHPVIYTVHADDGSTREYQVTVRFAPPSSAKSITSFSFREPAATGMIVGTKIDVTVPFRTPLTALVASFVLAPQATASISGTPQVSGVTPVNFTQPVVYTVTAQDGTSIDYTVTVKIAAGSGAHELKAFSFAAPRAVGTITGAQVDISVPSGSPLTALVATFTLSPGATASVGATPQTSGVTANDFTTPVTYTITAEDGSTGTYTVTVRLSPNAIISFSFESLGASGVVTGTSVAVLVPNATDVSRLVATFTLSPGAVASVAGATQTSGVTMNNFSAPVTYRVTATDGSTQDYVVQVTVDVGTAIELYANFQTLPNGLTDNVETTVPLTAVQPVMNTGTAGLSIIGKLKVAIAQAAPLSTTFSPGCLQFANNTTSLGKLTITPITGPFRLRLNVSPASTGDVTRKLRITVDGTEVYFFGDGTARTVDYAYYGTNTVTVDVYGFDGVQGKGVRVFDLWLMR